MLSNFNSDFHHDISWEVGYVLDVFVLFDYLIYEFSLLRLINRICNQMLPHIQLIDRIIQIFFALKILLVVHGK